jgi:hypothetical protein
VKLGLISESTANAYYRAIFPMRALSARGHTVLWPEDGKDAPMRELLSCDLVHCYRRMDRLADLRAFVRHGVPLSFDNDDNYAAAEDSKEGPGLKGRQLNNRLARLTLEAARTADLMTTTCAPLRDHYRAAGVERIAVIGNRIDSRVMTGFGSKSKHDGVVLGWVAEREHRIEAERLPIAQALAKLLELHPELRIVTVGLRLQLRSDRYRHVSRVPFLQLLKTTSTFDIGIAPLADTEFNRSRSDVKLKEYSSGGAAWLASPVGPYLGLGEAHGGMLVADDEWVEKASELILNARKRRRLSKHAVKWAKSETIDRHAKLWEGAFAETIDRARSTD